MHTHTQTDMHTHTGCRFHHFIRKNFLAVLTVRRGGIPDWADPSLFLELLKQRSLDLLRGLLQRELCMRVRAGPKDL